MQRILLAYDGSEPARRAAAVAAELARKTGATITVLTVGELVESDYGAMVPVVEPEVMEAVRDEGVRLCQEAGAQAEGRLVWGRPGEEIVRIAGEEGFDLIVTGHRGRGGVLSWLLGSVAKYVIDHASCSVLVVR